MVAEPGQDEDLEQVSVTVQRQHDTRQRALAALAESRRDNRPISVAGLARAAGIAHSWIYTQHGLLDEIQNSRTTTPRLPTQPRTTATDDSWKHRLELAHHRIQELTNENRLLRDQLARAHGHLRAHRDPPPVVPS
ncbi:DUF6262 family protein [Actinoplanes sp. KI2]|uniref:DUF6262 family protein n=1 Tax=Actinoplanes sp. KI2 TaxID=2983315 RepID=UPI0039839B74